MNGANYNRDFKGLLTAIKSVARIRASLKETVPNRLEATYEDYEIVREVFGSSFITSSTSVTPTQRKIYEVISEHKGIGYEEIGLVVGHKRNTVNAHCKVLEEQGLVSIKDNNKHLVFKKEELPDDSGLPTVALLKGKENEPTVRQPTPEPIQSELGVEVSGNNPQSIKRVDEEGYVLDSVMRVDEHGNYTNPISAEDVFRADEW